MSGNFIIDEKILATIFTRMDIFVKMRNVLKKENVIPTVPVKMPMVSVISQITTTVSGVMLMLKSVNQVLFKA